jgi:hypothetical protein
MPRRLDHHPRVIRKKKPVAVLDDDQARLTLPEKQYRELLFKEFVSFARQHDGVVISVPWRSPAVVLVPLGEPSRLEIALSCLPKYPFVQLPGTAARLSHGAFSELRRIAVRLWP